LHPHSPATAPCPSLVTFARLPLVGQGEDYLARNRVIVNKLESVLFGTVRRERERAGKSVGDGERRKIEKMRAGKLFSERWGARAHEGHTENAWQCARAHLAQLRDDSLTSISVIGGSRAAQARRRNPAS
jgi:hypothetical protein